MTNPTTNGVEALLLLTDEIALGPRTMTQPSYTLGTVDRIWLTGILRHLAPEQRESYLEDLVDWTDQASQWDAADDYDRMDAALTARRTVAATALAADDTARAALTFDADVTQAIANVTGPHLAVVTG